MERDGQVEDSTVKQGALALYLAQESQTGRTILGRIPIYQTCEANLFNVHILLDLLGNAPLSWPPCSHPAK